MGIVSVPSFGEDPVSVTGPALDAKVDGIATEFNGNIENANIKAGAAIAYSKLNLTGQILNADLAGSIASAKLASVDLGKLTIESQAAGDIAYASSSSAYTRLAKGTASQILAMKSDASVPEWTSFSTFNTAANAFAGSIIQVVNKLVTTSGSTTTALPYDNSVPTQSEGGEIISQAFTPASASSKILIIASVVYQAVGSVGVISLHKGTDASICVAQGGSSTNDTGTIILHHFLDSWGAEEATLSIRGGHNGGSTFYWNRSVSVDNIFGNKCGTGITIIEIKA